MTLPERQNNSIVQIRVGNKTFDAVYEPRCKVCNHPARFGIEEKLLRGFKYSEISRWVSDVRKQKPDGEIEEWFEVEPSLVKSHYQRGHVPLDSEMMAEFSKRRAEELGIEYEEAMIPVVDHIVVQKAILAKGYEAMVMGDIQPDVKDTLAASKLLADREKDLANNSSAEEWQTAMAVYFEAVRQVVDQDQWVQIINVLQTNPVLQQMRLREEVNTRALQKGSS